MRITLDLDKTTVGVGDTLRMTIKVKNEGLLPVSHTRPSAQKYDFWVNDGNRTLWLWGYGWFFTTEWQDETYFPGDERAGSETWNLGTCLNGETGGPPPTPGKYTARGQWHSENGAWWSNPADFEIR